MLRKTGCWNREKADLTSRFLLPILPDVSKVLTVCNLCILNRIVVAHASAALLDRRV